LRKALFPVQKPLKFAGVLNPLDGMHHLRANDLHIQFREGVVIDKPVKKGHGSFCDVGLEKVSVYFIALKFDKL
jgi:predicted SPOUT superfamily RNA methylase MTH1